MMVFRHLGPTAVRALLLVFACSFVWVMFPRQLLHQFRSIPADVREQLSHESFGQPQQAVTSGTWHNRPDYNQPLHGQEQVHHPLNNPLQQYGDGAVSLPSYPQRLYSGEPQLQSPSYHNIPASPIHQPPTDVEFGDPGIKLGSSPGQGSPSFPQRLDISQVPQHQQLGYYNPSHGYDEAGLLSHPFQDQGGEVHLHNHPNQPQPYDLAYQPPYEAAQGAGPSHLPDQKQEDARSYFPRTLPSEESEWLQYLRKRMKGVDECRPFADYAPVRMSDFLGFDADHGAQQLGKEEIKSRLRAQFQGWTQPYVDLLFDPKYVSTLTLMTDSHHSYFASETQRKIVFNIIMLRMLTKDIGIGLINKAFVLERIVGVRTVATAWMRRIGKKQTGREVVKTSRSTVAIFVRPRIV
ncbi:hypothetical protein ACQY0O_005197 [Thecaphora frezii]